MTSVSARRGTFTWPSTALLWKSPSRQDLDVEMPKYRGVSHTRGRYVAYVSIERRFVSCGSYDTAREAAIARDRAVIFLGQASELNLPDDATRCGPLDPKELRRLQKLEQKRKKAASQYLGVTYAKDARNWCAWAPGLPMRFIGAFKSERDAAIARDRVALSELGEAELNFPDDGLRPATLEAMRRLARQLRKVNDKHRYLGVRRDENKETFCWSAAMRADGREYHLGNWRTEREAVIAWDRAALYLKPDRAVLNLPKVSPALGPASPEELREEAHRRFKETTTSRYHGVHWNDANDGWIAKIMHRGVLHHLGTFRDELEAACVYDEAARSLKGKKAKTNFNT